MARASKRVNRNSRRNGGTGTRVGNLLRRITNPILNSTGRSTLGNQTASVNNFRVTTAPNNPSQVVPTGSIVSRETQRQANRGNLSTSQLGNIYSSPAPRQNNASYDQLSTRDRINQNIAGGGNQLGPNNVATNQNINRGRSNSQTMGQNATNSSFAPVVGSRITSSESQGLTQGSSLGSSSPNLPSTNVVATPTLGLQNTKLTLPEQAVTDYSTAIPTTQEQLVAQAQDNTQNSLQDYLASIMDAPSSADAYARAQRETDILARQQEVSDLQGQLNGIVARGESQQLAQVGQGRGIPEAIIGGIQAQIGRETAIASLPVAAQLSAAQGNLEMANENLDTLFKIYSDDAKNEYEYKREVKKAVYDFASAKEKRELEKMDKLEERAYQETQDLNDERSMYAKMAFETGQSSLGAKIAKLDYKSPTFRQELASLSSGIVDSKRQLEIQKLQQDLASSGTTINPKILNTTQFKNAQAAQNLKLTLDKAKAAVEKYGNREVLSGEGAGILNSLKVQLRSEISTALEQGVVVPGEAAAFDQIAGQLNKNFFIRNKKTLASLNSLSQSMDGRVALQKSALVNTYQVSPEQVDTLLNIIDLSDQEFYDMDALID